MFLHLKKTFIRGKTNKKKCKLPSKEIYNESDLLLTATCDTKSTIRRLN